MVISFLGVRTDGRTDGQTDGRTDRRTDRQSLKTLPYERLNLKT